VICPPADNGTITSARRSSDDGQKIIFGELSSTWRAAAPVPSKLCKASFVQTGLGQTSPLAKPSPGQQALAKKALAKKALAKQKGRRKSRRPCFTET
jgi:hypothetical protein